MAFQCERADLPSSSASRKPWSVSPNGVLTAIPVITTLRGADKVDLHDGHGADGPVPDDLSGARDRVGIGVEQLHQYGKLVAGPDLRLEKRMVDPQGPGWKRNRIARDVLRLGRAEVDQAEPQLAHDFQLQDRRIHRPAGKVPGEHRIVGVHPATASGARMHQQLPWLAPLCSRVEMLADAFAALPRTVIHGDLGPGRDSPPERA